MEEVTEIEIGGYRFMDSALLENALTHSSYLHEHPEENAPDFERLEFLGDAVVDRLKCRLRRHCDDRLIDRARHVADRGVRGKPQIGRAHV